MLIDLHNHTSPISRCSLLKPVELVQRAIEVGLDGICLTEHDKIWPFREADRLAREHDFLILRGMEVTTNTGHVLVFGLDQDARGFWDARRQGYMDVKQLKSMVDSVGGAMVLAHPLRHRLYGISKQELPSIFDALEVLNGGEPSWCNQETSDLAVAVGLCGTGGSDAHARHDVGMCATEFRSDIRNEKDMIAALKNQDFQPRRLR